MNKASLSFQGKQLWLHLLPMIKSAPSTMYFLWWDSGDTKEYDFLILHRKKCQHLEDLHNSRNHYFPNDQCMHISKLLRVRDPIKVQNRQIDSNVTVQKVHWYSFRVHIVTLRNYHFSSAGILSEDFPKWSERAIKIISPFPNTYLREAGFSSYMSTKTIYSDSR